MSEGLSTSVKTNADKIAAEFRMLARDASPAVARALNRIGEMARTQTAKGLRAEGYNFTSGEIKREIYLAKATAAALITKLKVRRRTRSLMEFDPRETKDGVTVKVKGGRKLIKGAFIAQRLNGVSGVFIEDKSAGKIVIRRQAQYARGSKGGWHAYPVRKLYGPSVGGAFVNERFQEELERFIDEKFAERVRHELKRMLHIK